MNIDDYVMRSVDDLAIEPPDLFEGKVLPNFGLNAVARRPKAEYGRGSNSFGDMRVGTYGVHEHFGVDDLHAMILDMIMPECDYPHSDSTWPQAPELLAKHFDAVSDDVVNKVSHENAMSLYSFAPYRIRPRERRTVGALRAEVAGHDISAVSDERHRGPKTATYGGIVSTGYRGESAEAKEVAEYNKRRAAAETAR